MADQPMLFSVFDVQRLESALERFARGGRPSGPLMALESRLEASDHTPPEAVPPDVVTMNSRVILEAVPSGEVFEFALVFPHEADLAAGRLSVLAPLGAALLGARVGADVEADTPAGTRTYRVRALSFQPEAAGRYDL